MAEVYRAWVSQAITGGSRLGLGLGLLQGLGLRFGSTVTGDRDDS